ncbi:MAG: pantetheine-phosphate adenylyltransferase [Muribaculaceae bacterium]|nr:pantetheine-phosphate adenylyltransferase [Muribaculaceae bacterium]
MRKMLYAGSFRPFTTGHKDIADRALALCDELVIAIGLNPDKPEEHIDERVRTIQKVYAGDNRVQVVTYTGLTCELARELGACALVRGVRGVIDFDYERNLADANKMLTGIETVLLLADPKLAAVSSSLVRELQRHGADTSEFIP